MFEPPRQVAVTAKDILSYIFDAPSYDQDKPVSK